jgi:hypothetical protein
LINAVFFNKPPIGSSYTGATLANIDVAGAKAQDDIGRAQSLAERDIDQNKALTEQQVAGYIRQLEGDYQTNVAAYQDAIRNQDLDRARAVREYSNQLEAALYELGQQQMQYGTQQGQWERTFAENHRQFEAQMALERDRLAKTKASGASTGNTIGGNTTVPAILDIKKDNPKKEIATLSSKYIQAKGGGGTTR